MVEDLIKRLSKVSNVESLGIFVRQLLHEAADAIESANTRLTALESERDALLAAAGKEAVACADEPEDGLSEVEKTVLSEQESLVHPATQVFFRAGLLACREYMARFVERESSSIAASIRANWWPSLGQDFGPPRLMNWEEMTVGEYGEEGFRAKTADEVSPTQEALPIALQFLQSLDPEKRGRVTMGLEGLERSLKEGVAALSQKAGE